MNCESNSSMQRSVYGENKTNSSMDCEISLNQEGNYEEDTELDLTLKTDDSEQTTAISSNDGVADECVNEIQNLMKERHELAKTKESIKYGLQTSKFPPWMTSYLKCDVKLATNDDTDRFGIFWNELSTKTIRNVMNETSDYLTAEIKEKEESMQACRLTTFKCLGVATKGSAEKKKVVDEKVKRLNTEFSNDLEDFRNKIRNPLQ